MLFKKVRKHKFFNLIYYLFELNLIMFQSHYFIKYVKHLTLISPIYVRKSVVSLNFEKFFLSKSFLF